MSTEPATVAQAGGIVFRFRGVRIEYLLIRPKRQPDQWIFPKGHIEPGESAVQAAVREVLEETGIEASPLASVGSKAFTLAGRRINVEYFVMEFRRTVGSGEGREMTWAPLDSALRLLTFPDTRELLLLACDRCGTPRPS